MKTSRFALCAVFAVAILLPAAARTARPARAQGPPAPAATLSGQLLVALPSLSDPRFTRTVIYMVKHDASGATGLIINRPIGDVPISVLLKQTGLPETGATGSIKLHVGGPVEPTRISVLHSDDYKGPETTLLAGGMAVTSQPDILEAIVAGKVRGARTSTWASRGGGRGSSRRRSVTATGSPCRRTAPSSSTMRTRRSGIAPWPSGGSTSRSRVLRHRAVGSVGNAAGGVGAPSPGHAESQSRWATRARHEIFGITLRRISPEDTGLGRAPPPRPPPSRSCRSPLPGGEGQGEGECDVSDQRLSVPKRRAVRSCRAGRETCS